MTLCSLCKQVQIEHNIDNGTSIGTKGFPTSRKYPWDSYKGTGGTPTSIMGHPEHISGIPYRLRDFHKCTNGTPLRIMDHLESICGNPTEVKGFP